LIPASSTKYGGAQSRPGGAFGIDPPVDGLMEVAGDALVDALAAPVDALAAPVDALAAPVDALAALVDALAALVDALAALVDALAEGAGFVDGFGLGAFFLGAVEGALCAVASVVVDGARSTLAVESAGLPSLAGAGDAEDAGDAGDVEDAGNVCELCDRSSSRARER
jgi:hypothetical protein